MVVASGGVIGGATPTFLFSDVEGSTQLLRGLGDRYPAVLGEVGRVLGEACSAHAGELVDTQGDSHFFVFPTPGAALAAAVEAQRGLATLAVPDGFALRVRIGLHTGAARSEGSRYYGLSVHRAARIGATARGGQVVVSETTATVLRDDESSLDGIELRDLGAFALKDFEQPVRLFGVVGDGLRTDFPKPAAANKEVGGSRRRLVLVAAVAVATLAAIAAGVAVWTGGGDTGGTVALEQGAVSLIDPAEHSTTADVPLDFVPVSEPGQAALGTDALWIADQNGQSVVAIDTESYERERTVGIGRTPRALALDGDELWLWHSQGVSIAYPTQRDVLSEDVPPSTTFEASLVSIATGDGAIWASKEDDLWKIDADAVAAGAATRLDDYATALAVGAGRVWIAGASTTLMTVETDGDGGTVSLTLVPATLSDLPDRDDAAAIATEDDVWIMGERTLWRVEPGSTQVTASVPVPTRSTVVWDGTRLWLASESSPELVQLDPRTLATIEVVPLSYPARLLAGDERGLWLYAARTADG